MPGISTSFDRRSFLRGAGVLAAGALLPEVVFARTAGSVRLVVIVMRGALDGLAAVPPHGDPGYSRLRGTLAIGAPGSPGGVLALDGTFGLHPALAFLHERYAAGELLVFHAVASPYRDRSHFDGQNVLETGLTRPIGSADGWLNRALASLPLPHSGNSSARALALSLNLPLILRGAVPVLSKSPSSAPDLDEDLLARLADLYSNDPWFSARLSEAVQSQKLGEETPGTAMPGSSPRIGGAARIGKATRIGAATRMAASLMRLDGGPNVAVIESTGWDTHANQGAADGVLAQNLTGLDDALRVLADGMGAWWDRTAVLMITEFGRTAAVNGTRGTDHGTGGCAFLVGGAVRGGRVIADWPGLSSGALLDNRDLRPTLDLRSVFKTVLHEHLGIDDRSLSTRVFPQSNGARALRGLMRA